MKVASSILDCTGKSAASTQRGVIPPLGHLALVRELLESSVHFWAPQYQLDHAILQSVQMRAPERHWHTMCKEMLGELQPPNRGCREGRVYVGPALGKSLDYMSARGYF